MSSTQNKSKFTKVSKNTAKLISFVPCVGFEQKDISVTLPDGNVKIGKSFVTSPYEIAKQISKQFADKVVVSKVKYASRVATLDDGLLNPEAEAGVDADD